MKDGNHVIARVADSHMPTSIMESEVRRVSFLWRYGDDSGLSLRADRDDAMGPRTDVDPRA